MAEIILQLPRTTLTMDEGRIVNWLKKPGDAVAEGEPVAEMETDKAVVEVAAPITGFLRRLIVEENVDVPIAAPIAVFTETADEPLGSGGAAAQPTAEIPPAAQENQQPHASALAAKVLELSQRTADVVRASPAVRIRARKEGVDLAAIPGSGPGGRILLQDYERFVGSRSAAPAVQAPVPAAAGRVGSSRMRASIAAAMLKSWREQPQFAITRHVDMSHVAQLRATLASAAPDQKLSFIDFVIQAFARALPLHPSLNVRTDASGAAASSQTVDMGIAVAVEDGLVVPVLRGAEKLTLPQIAAGRAELTRRALDNRLGAQDLGGGTFTVSNLGPFGVDQFNAIVNPGEAAIVAVGRIRETPVALEGQVVIRPMLSMTLSVDHRLADGAAGARLLQDVAERLEGRLGWILF
ncbi:MAG: dihydrolipoamide acetyltransferase family protein [Thermaerobacter sp.]|nr:dihydrolipoamide acetyltransferase family protein [Thermaerobacter sp.]